MTILTQTGVGATTHAFAIRDTAGTGLLPLQAAVSGTVTFRVLARVNPAAPWVEIKAAGTVGFLESFSWVPYLQLEVTAGTGTATLYIGEK